MTELTLLLPGAEDSPIAGTSAPSLATLSALSGVAAWKEALTSLKMAPTRVVAGPRTPVAAWIAAESVYPGLCYIVDSPAGP